MRTQLVSHQNVVQAVLAEGVAGQMVQRGTSSDRLPATGVPRADAIRWEVRPDGLNPAGVPGPPAVAAEGPA